MLVCICSYSPERNTAGNTMYPQLRIQLIFDNIKIISEYKNIALDYRV